MVNDHLLRRRLHNTALRLGHRCHNIAVALKACVALFLQYSTVNNCMSIFQIAVYTWCMEGCHPVFSELEMDLSSRWLHFLSWISVWLFLFWISTNYRLIRNLPSMLPCWKKLRLIRPKFAKTPNKMQSLHQQLLRIPSKPMVAHIPMVWFLVGFHPFRPRLSGGLRVIFRVGEIIFFLGGSSPFHESW